MKRLIDAIIKKWFCCHEWKFLFERKVEVVDYETDLRRSSNKTSEWFFNL